MASPRETTLRVSALRTVPSGVERADVRSLITQGPISVGPPADPAADVRGVSAVALVADDIAVEFVSEPVTQVTPPPPLRIVESEPAKEVAAPVEVAAPSSLPRWVKPALLAGAALVVGLLAFAIGTPTTSDRETQPSAIQTPAAQAPIQPEERSAHEPASVAPRPPQPSPNQGGVPPTSDEPVPEAETPDDAELTLLIEEDHAKPRPRKRSPNRKATADLLADGGVSLAIGDRDAAVDTFEQVLRRRPKSATAAAGLANAHFDEGRFDLAAAYATRAVKAEFKEPSHHVLLGDAYYRLGQHDDAEVQWTTAQRLGSARATRRLAKL